MLLSTHSILPIPRDGKVAGLTRDDLDAVVHDLTLLSEAGPVGGDFVQEGLQL